MKNVGIAELPLHYGECPKWLFERMKKLGKCITEAIILEYSKDEFLKRISDPFFFQSFACVLGFDWHSSGVTTTLCGALKEALNNENLGIYVAGGKGKVSRKTPEEIEKIGEKINLSTKNIEKLIYSSKMSAKIDNIAVQDGYNLYHHCFIFSEDGKWVVIQQGMNIKNKYARRYHWISEKIKKFTEEPHNAICCDKKEDFVLDMTSKENAEIRKVSVELVKDNIGKRLMRQSTLNDFFEENEFCETKNLKMPFHHEVKIDKNVINSLIKAYEINPKDFEELLEINGVGQKTIRALALISQIIYGKEISWKDPVKFSFAHGGKDGTPYRINKNHYDTTIEILTKAIEEAKLGEKEKLFALKRLSDFMK